MTERVEIRGVSMYPSDWETVEAFARAEGRSVSDALRRIVKQWLATQRERARLAADALCDEEAAACVS